MERVPIRPRWEPEGAGADLREPRSPVVTVPSAGEALSPSSVRANRAGGGLYALPGRSVSRVTGPVSPFRLPLDIEDTLWEPRLYLPIVPRNPLWGPDFPG